MNVYILGFGYDFSEIDLWWLLNRKKNEKVKNNGRVIFYNPIESHESEREEIQQRAKLNLLEINKVEIRNLNMHCNRNDDYVVFYEHALEDIKGGRRK